jgi:branched-chain amino acid transport system permease protein
MPRAACRARVTGLVELAQYLLNGLAFGSILALAAVGLTLVYGVLGLANFAHGDLLTLGAYGVFLFAVLTPLPQAELAALALAALLLAAGLAGPRVRVRGRARLEPGEGGAVVAVALWLGGLALGTMFPLLPLDREAALLLAALLAALAWRAARTRPGAAPLLLGLAGACGLAGVAAPYLLGTALAAVLAAGVALQFEVAVWRPLRKRRATVLTLLIVSIGVAFVLRNGIALRFGSDFLDFQRPLQLPYALGPLVLTADQAATMAAAAVSVLGLHLFLQRTRTGRALRALGDDRDLALVSGVDVDRAVLVVWLLAAGLAAVAGAMLPLNDFAVSPSIGFTLLLTVFAAVILGGIGSPYGAMLGGLAIGLASELTAGLWRAEYKFAAAFAVLVLVLLVRPQGVLGGRA